MDQTTRRSFLKTAAATSVGGIFLSGSTFGQAVKRTKAAKSPQKVEPQDPYADAILKPGPPPMPEAGSFTMIALPDTKGYSQHVPATYLAQTKWIVDEKQKRNIASVVHLGDITNNNTHDQWKNAEAAMRLLDDQVPYFFTLGNHDYGENGGAMDRTTFFHQYFPRDKYSSRPDFGGSYDREPDRFDNGYYFFNAGDRAFLVLSLEFGPRNDVVRWANEVVDEHADKSVILITHAFVYYDDTRYDWAKYGAKQHWNPHSYPVAKASNHDVNDGQELWDKLISRHKNFVMTLNGHVCGDGLGRVVTKLGNGQELPQMLCDYQIRPRGGDGWLRLLEFRPDYKTVMVYDYSVTRNECNDSPDATFKVTIPS
ncbi:MAG TPA: metallophosphoesterase [Lacipirellulaceae bacterium]